MPVVLLLPKNALRQYSGYPAARKAVKITSKRGVAGDRLEEKGGEKMSKQGYEGKVSNAGAQVVTAVNKQPKPPKAETIHTGKDLRGKAGSK